MSSIFQAVVSVVQSGEINKKVHKYVIYLFLTNFNLQKLTIKIIASDSIIEFHQDETLC